MSIAVPPFIVVRTGNTFLVVNFKDPERTRALYTECDFADRPETRMILVVVASVAWLQGCWQMAAGDRVVEEQWMAPRAGVMLEMGRTVRGNQLVEYEWVLLRDRDGVLEYEAHPSGQPVAVFSARTVTANEVVFENPTHGFPQRVGYRRDGDSLLGWIEGTANGTSRRVEFPYRRAVCQPGN